VLLVLNYFMSRLSMTKSSDLRSVFLRGHVSRRYNTSITCRWRTCATRRITETCCKQRWTLSVINLQLNQVDSTCDGRRFRVIASYFSKFATFNLLTCIWHLRSRWPRLSFAEIFSVRKPDSLGCRVALLRDPAFSRFIRTPSCGRQTDRHDYGIYRASVASRSINR